MIGSDSLVPGIILAGSFSCPSSLGGRVSMTPSPPSWTRNSRRVVSRIA